MKVMEAAMSILSDCRMAVALNAIFHLIEGS